MKIRQTCVILGIVLISIQLCTAFVGPTGSTIIKRLVEDIGFDSTRKIFNDRSVPCGTQEHSLTVLHYRNHDEDDDDSSRSVLLNLCVRLTRCIAKQNHLNTPEAKEAIDTVRHVPRHVATT